METQKYRIVIVDDNQGFIDAIKILFRNRTDIDVVGEATDGFKFLEMVEHANPDIVLMDINLPTMDGLAATEKALLKNGNLQIFGVTMSDDFIVHFNMLKTGFKAGILKNNFSSDFDIALQAINKGEVFFPVLKK
jgi:two-component system, NarL family, response regulator DegU